MPKSRHSFDPRLLEGSIVTSLFLLAFPIMGANLLQIAYQLIDAFWVGRLGAAAIAAVSISMPIMFLMISAGLGFAVARRRSGDWIADQNSAFLRRGIVTRKGRDE